MSDTNGTILDSSRDCGTSDGGQPQGSPFLALQYGSPEVQNAIRGALNKETAASGEFMGRVTGGSSEALEEEVATGAGATELAPVAPYLPLLAFSSDDRIFCHGDNGEHWWEAVNPETGCHYTSEQQCFAEHQRRFARERQEDLDLACTDWDHAFSSSPADSPVEVCSAPVEEKKVVLAPKPYDPSTDVFPDSSQPTTGVIHLRCDPDWNECQKEQAREKVRQLNRLAKENSGLVRRPTTGRIRNAGNAWAAKYRSDFDRQCAGDPPSRLNFTAEGVKGPTGTREDFMSDCLYQQWLKSGKCESGFSPLNQASPDHLQDLQWGGQVQGQMKWLDRDVNEKLGRDMNSEENADVDIATGFELVCC
jgi:hypothetical protein